MPPLVTAEQARVVLFGKSKAKFNELPDEMELADRDNDALFYATIQPDHDAQGYNADRKRKTAAEL